MKEQIGVDRLTGLLAFAKVASLGSYTAAGRAMSLSPSAVSKSVLRLEASLGFKLFSRTTRSVTLTPEGAELHARTLRLLHEIDGLEQAAAATKAEPAGALKITAPIPIAVNIIAPVLPSFQMRFPKLKIDLRVSDQITDVIEEGIDVAIRVGELADSRLISRKLGSHRVCAYASPSYLNAFGKPSTVEELRDHRCINFRYQNNGQSLRWSFQTVNRTHEFFPDVTIVADVSEAVAAMLAANGGIGLLPTYVAAPYVRRHELLTILPELTTERFHIYALWPQSRRGSPNVKAFLNFLGEVFPDPAPWDTFF